MIKTAKILLIQSSRVEPWIYLLKYMTKKAIIKSVNYFNETTYVETPDN